MEFNTLNIANDRRRKHRRIIAIVEEFYQLFRPKRCCSDTHRRKAGRHMLDALHQHNVDELHRMLRAEGVTGVPLAGEKL